MRNCSITRRPSARPAAPAPHVHRQLDELPDRAIGLALPGNGTILASHSYRKDLFKRAAKQVVKIAHQYYDDSDDSVLPRSIATKEAFENA